MILVTGEVYSVREFMELAFAKTDQMITWTGGCVAERGPSAKTGQALVEIGTRYFRPTAVDLLLDDPIKMHGHLDWRHETNFA